MVNEENEFYISLTKKEKKVMELLSRGCRVKKIAELLYVSPNTITSHLVHIYSKLGMQANDRDYDVRILAVNKYRRMKKEKEQEKSEECENE